mmetsp:Transcript_10675/g.30057  ORF Transcript_10675/g.30057 Transcript_10675/m.30057 type:complete len:136 (-) Transcript_10675:211-618(-)
MSRISKSTSTTSVVRLRLPWPADDDDDDDDEEDDDDDVNDDSAEGVSKLLPLSSSFSTLVGFPFLDLPAALGALVETGPERFADDLRFRVGSVRGFLDSTDSELESRDSLRDERRLTDFVSFERSDSTRLLRDPL